MATWNCFQNIQVNGENVAKDVATLQCLEPLFANVVRSVVALSAVGLFVMMFVGGYNFLYSAGDQKKLAQARGTITNAIIGQVVLAVSYLIIRAIGTFVGVDLTKFEIPRQ